MHAHSWLFSAVMITASVFGFVHAEASAKTAFTPVEAAQTVLSVVVLGADSVAGPVLTVAPSTLTFGSLQIGETSTLHYELTGDNMTEDVSVTAPQGFQVSLSAEGGFQTTVTVPLSDTGVDTTVFVRFAPTSPGGVFGHVINTSSGLTRNIGVAGTGISLPFRCIELIWEGIVTIPIFPPPVVARPIDFGSVPAGSEGTKSFRIRNCGNAVLTVQLLVQGVDFRVVSGTFSVAPGTERLAVVRFTPTSTGSKNGQLFIIHNAENVGSPIVIPLRGQAISPQTLSVIPASLDFGDVLVGNTPVNQYKLSGNGLTSDVRIVAPPGFDVSLNEAGGFQDNLTVEPTDSRIDTTIFVRFSATDTATYSGQIDNSGTGISKSVNVTGRGVEPTPLIHLESDTLDFGRVSVGRSTTLHYQLAASGLSGEIAMRASPGFLISLDSASAFVDSLVIESQVADVDTTIYVRFVPSEPIFYKGTVTHLSEGLFRELNLYGEGLRRVAVLSANPNSLDFGEVERGESKMLSYEIVGKDFGDDLTVTATPAFLLATRAEPSGMFTDTLRVSHQDGSVAQTIYVKFVPWDVGSYSGHLIHESAEMDSVITVQLSGHGVDGVSTGITDARVPTDYALQPNYPNPFNPTTAIRFELPVRQHVVLEVFDMLGRSVAVLADAVLEPGYHELYFHADNLPSGPYLYRIEAGDFRATRTMSLLK